LRAHGPAFTGSCLPAVFSITESRTVYLYPRWRKQNHGAVSLPRLIASPELTGNKGHESLTEVFCPLWLIFHLALLCPTQEKVIEAQEILSSWLRLRELRLADEKTHIRHLHYGFNFLVFNIRHYSASHSSRSGY
jgi:hypothetical protein